MDVKIGFVMALWLEFHNKYFSNSKFFIYRFSTHIDSLVKYIAIYSKLRIQLKSRLTVQLRSYWKKHFLLVWYMNSRPIQFYFFVSIFHLYLYAYKFLLFRIVAKIKCKIIVQKSVTWMHHCTWRMIIAICGPIVLNTFTSSMKQSHNTNIEDWL